MADIARLGIEIDSKGVPVADKRLKTLEKTAGKTETATGKLKKTWGTLGKLMAAGAVFMGIRAVVRAADEGQQAFKQLVAGLRSTEGASGQTISSLVALSNEMQRTTKFADDLVQSASAILLSFTNIADDAFPRTMRAAANVATRMGTSLQTAVVQLGKALNDPIQNLGALSRSGIQFSKAQKAVIKELVMTNKLADAQNIILIELEKQYGGSAVAARDTLGGAVANLKNEFSDFAEAIGKVFGRPLAGLFNIVSGALNIFSKAVAVVVGESEKLLAIEKELGRQEKKRLLTGSQYMQQETEAERVRRERLEDEKEIAEVLKRINDAQKEGAGIIDALKTQEEKLNETKQRLIFLYKEGAVSADDFSVAMQRLNEQIIEAGKGATDGFDEISKGVEKTKEKTKELVEDVLPTLKDRMQSIWVGWSTSFIDNLVEGELAAKDAFKNIAVDFAKMVAKMLLQQAAMKLTAKFFPPRAEAHGDAFSNGRVLPFARGGVVTQPTIFPMANGAGLMGEAGPEAVMPLTRTSGGDLGVKAEGLINVNVINNTGADVTESRRSTAQGMDIDIVIGESVKQHLNKGTFDRSMQSSFGVSRRGLKR